MANPHTNTIPLSIHSVKLTVFPNAASEDAHNIVVHSKWSGGTAKANTTAEAIAAAKLSAALTDDRIRARAAFMRSLRVPMVVVAGVAV
ncbi:hypothetical protein F5144DRAFT_601998 [Chaetomium tenue]|uniref:Uncharacterized protein n=1 Tax=Chaetomium tenue TaxID=1854479 RepID=A0ACB7PH78_9PEZI|nr:hypothetical protein F5144DRAFT_601998 [Chaetomium globosum]